MYDKRKSIDNKSVLGFGNRIRVGGHFSTGGSMDRELWGPKMWHAIQYGHRGPPTARQKSIPFKNSGLVHKEE